MKQRRRETTAMTTVDCPWCQGPAEMTSAAFECAECGVTVAVADKVEALPIAA